MLKALAEDLADRTRLQAQDLSDKLATGLHDTDDIKTTLEKVQESRKLLQEAVNTGNFPEFSNPEIETRFESYKEERTKNILDSIESQAKLDHPEMFTNEDQPQMRDYIYDHRLRESIKTVTGNMTDADMGRIIRTMHYHPLKGQAETAKRNMTDADLGGLVRATNDR